MSVVTAVSLRRPWPTAIFRFQKDVENRTWSTRHRGLIVIHGAATFDIPALDFMRELGYLPAEDPDAHAKGFIGTIELYDICPGTRVEVGGCWEPSTDWLRGRIYTSRCGPWAMRGSRHWKIRNPQPFREPIPAPGRQGVYVVDTENADKIRKAVQ